MTGVVTRFVDIRAGELRPALRAFATLLFVIAGHTVLETARDALFLETLPASRLTLVYMMLAGLGLLVPWYSAGFIRRFGRRDAVVFSLMVAAFGTTWLHFQPATPVMVFVIYGWSGLLATVMVVQFWMLAGQLFTVGQGKRLFPLVAAGGVLGAAAGGAGAATMLALLRSAGDTPAAAPSDPAGAHSLLLLAAALFVVAALVVASADTDDRGTDGRGHRPERAPALLRGLMLLRDEPYVARIAVVVALGTAAVLATDYLFKYAAKAALPAAELGSFFAQYYAAMNGVALLMQLFVAMRVVQRLGVAAGLAVLPLFLLGGGAGVLILGGGLIAVLITKGADGALRHSLHRVSSELMYMPLSAEVREPSKSLVDSVVVRGAQALTAAVILGIAAAELESVKTLAALVTVLAGAWALSALAIRGRYVDLFRKKLSRGTLDPALRFDDLDVRSVEAVMAALSSPDETRVVAAMDLIAQSGRTRLIPALILYHQSVDVLLRALEIVPQPGRDDWIPHAERLLSHDDGAVRLAAVRALGRASQLASLDQLVDPTDPALRATAAFFVARADRAVAPQDHPALVEVLAAIPRQRLDSTRSPSLPPPGLESASMELRLALLDALATDGDDRWVDVLFHLADCADGKVIERVALAIAKVNDPRFVPLLVRRLALRQGRAAARDALVAFGEPALDALEDALSSPDTSATVRLHIPRSISRFGNQRAADLLTAHLSAKLEGAVRYKILRGLGSLVMRHDVQLDGAAIEEAIETNLREHLRLLSLEAPLRRWMSDPSCCDNQSRQARASGQLLVGLLEDKGRQALERAFRLFQLVHRNEDVRGIYLALQSPDHRKRAAALEFLEALSAPLPDQGRELFRLVADDLEPEDRLARASAHVPAPPGDGPETLRRLMKDADTSVAALTAYHVNALAHPELGAELDELRDQRPSLGLFGELTTPTPAPERSGDL